MPSPSPESLFNTEHLPPEWKAARLHARKARAYHELRPYPKWAFTAWKIEERGPYPRCRPFPRHIVSHGAQFLFGRPVSFYVAGEDAAGGKAPLTDALNLAIDASGLTQRLVAMAELGGQVGSVFLSFDYDPGKKRLGFHVHDGVESVRLFWDQFEHGRLLMARFQYPYFDAAQGKWLLHREEWTDAQRAEYEPKALPLQWSPSPENWSEGQWLEFEGGKWPAPAVSDNPFKVIPGVQVQNLDVGGEFGLGDLWGLWELVDNVNFTHDLAHKDNQMAVRPKRYLLDVKPKAEDAPSPAAPGDATELSSEHDKHPGRVEEFKGDPAVREPMRRHADDLLDEIYLAAGSVRISAAEVTNKGQMTSAVLSQLYAPLIETTERKRNSYGENGLCRLFETAMVGLRNAGAAEFKGVPDGVDVQADWPDYFDRTEDEKTSRANRHAMLMEKGLTTQEQAAREVHSTEGVPDLDRLIAEIKAQPARAEGGEGNNGKGKDRPGGDTGDDENKG